MAAIKHHFIGLHLQHSGWHSLKKCGWKKRQRSSPPSLRERWLDGLEEGECAVLIQSGIAPWSLLVRLLSRVGVVSYRPRPLAGTLHSPVLHPLTQTTSNLETIRLCVADVGQGFHTIRQNNLLEICAQGQRCSLTAAFLLPSPRQLRDPRAVDRTRQVNRKKTAIAMVTSAFCFSLPWANAFGFSLIIE